MRSDLLQVEDTYLLFPKLRLFIHLKVHISFIDFLKFRIVVGHTINLICGLIEAMFSSGFAVLSGDLWP